MPHLSPLAWALAPFIFFFLLCFMHSALWWIQMPTFVLTNSLKALPCSSFNSWKW